MFEKKALEQIKADKEKWEEGPVKKTLSRAPERREVFTSISNIPVERLYTPLDTQDHR